MAAASPSPLRFPATCHHQPKDASPRRITYLRTKRYQPLVRARGYADEEDSDELKSGQSRMFVLGMGYVGRIFAQELQKEDWIVSGTCMNLEKKKSLEQYGFHMYQFDATDPDPGTLNCIKGHTHLLVSVPPDKHCRDPMVAHEELWRSSLMGGNLKWLGYLSTTSVYGDCGGAWVDEDYPASPSSESAKLRLAAEEGWLRFGHDLKVSSHIFRLGGIYGPGRRNRKIFFYFTKRCKTSRLKFFYSWGMLLSLELNISAVDTILKDTELSGSQRKRMSKQYTSRVHVADICQALRASIQSSASSAIYNVVDDDPAPRREVLAFARNLLNQKWPDRFKKTTSSKLEEHEDMDEVVKGEKRVSNARMKKELGVKLLHPSYRSGLESIINQMNIP